MFTSNCHPPIPPEPWLSRRPDLWLPDILHKTATGGLRAGCDAQLLALYLTTGLIRFAPFTTHCPVGIDEAELPAVRRQEGHHHRRLRLLGLSLAQAIDPQSLIIEEHRAPIRDSHTFLDVYIEARFGRLAIELGARDGRDIPPLLRSVVDHVLVLPFSGWNGTTFVGGHFFRPDSRPLAMPSFKAMADAFEHQTTTITQTH
jgi:hypothetical protein